MHWCPRCRGVLLSPAPVDAPPARRNYRWVARPPGRGARPARPNSAPVADPATPRYTEIPRWGLVDNRREEVRTPPTRISAATDWLVGRVAELLLTTIILFSVSALAEFGRYLILLRNRSRLIHPLVLLISDVSVYVTAAAALICALVTAVGVIGWLIRARRDAYAQSGRSDPRSALALWCGGVIPLVNLVMAGVFLIELVRRLGSDPRLLRAARIWWAVWALNGVMVILAQFMRGADTLQGQANDVIFTVYTDLVAAATAVATLWVMRMCAGRDLHGRIRRPKRWLPASGPAVSVIEPVRPVSERQAGEQEEVMAQ